jgi:hypothetical protein
MTWKLTAAAGVATITATWLASHAPVGRPAVPRSTAPSVARTELAAAEIQREADRLHSRLAQVTAYRGPARNPFEFRERPVVTRAPRPEPVMTIEELPGEDVVGPATLRLTLAGIAEDTVGEELVRTAIISTPGDVLLVKLGDRVGDQFTVAAIDADAVQLVRVDNGASVRLTLKP